MNADSPPGGKRYGNQATQRVIGMLAHFVGAADTFGVSELSRELGINKNMVHRFMTTLVEAGYLVRDPTGERYQLGYRLLDLRVDDDMIDVRFIARPTLEQLHRLTGESVFLSIVVGSSRVNVDWIEAQGRRVSFGQRGRSVPLHTTMMSRLLLAHLSDADITRYLASAGPLDRAEHSLVDSISISGHREPEVVTFESVWDDVREMRGIDHLTWRSPQQFGAGYAAYTIPGVNGRLHGIITIGGPSERFDPDATIKDPAVNGAIQGLRQLCATLPPAPVVIPAARR